ncbi:kinase-like protein [Schizopora paradoxa]|uniref:Kinase-like protein n=1 Tax=Schizopora paradoxa TaxID=27342 RepID=A0A0H2RB43_9AGAM|nr:kinase-like protein [Schizopora paradoxa]
MQGESAKRFEKKKSIRIVAAEHRKKIEDRSLRATSQPSMIRKRSTKLWGSKIEETPVQTSSPSTTKLEIAEPRPVFKWIRGEVLSKYTYGRVYLALNASTGEMMTAKQVELREPDEGQDDCRQPGAAEMLKRESEILKDLDHPNIIQYLGSELTPDFMTIFLEYIPGCSLSSCLLKHGKFDDQITRSFTEQILDGLAYLHDKGIVHRNLKADNILVNPSGICMISDFSNYCLRRESISAENRERPSFTTSVFWMAPEVIGAMRTGEQRGFDEKADIWSLGCTVLEMWSGCRPWEDRDAVAVIFDLITKTRPPVPVDVELSSEADEFMQKCFTIEPNERPSATELRKHPYLILKPDWIFTGFK